MKKIKFIYFVFFAFMLTACSNSFSSSELTYISEEATYIKSDTVHLSNVYNVNDFIKIDNKIIATDDKNDCLLIINLEDGDIEEIGTTGNGNDNYLAPHGICYKDNLIYVVDSGNSRIKILDQNLNFKKTISLSSIEFLDAVSTSFDDISVDDNGNIFFTVKTPIKKYAKLYCIESGSDMPKIIMNDCMGIVASFENKTYFANTFEFVGDTTIQSGDNYIYEIENGEIINSYSLLNYFAPTGICVNEDGIYCSGLSRKILKLDMNTLTMTRLFSETVSYDEIDEEKKEYGALNLENNVLWLVETNNNEIYKLTEE